MSAVTGFFRETSRAPRATSPLVHLADAFAEAHRPTANKADLKAEEKQRRKRFEASTTAVRWPAPTSCRTAPHPRPGPA